MQSIQAYFQNIKREFDSNRAREHSYRPALKALLESLNPAILATNEPKRERCGAPDFIITDQKNIPRGYIEAKDILPHILDDKANQAQIQKYFDGELGYNFIHTDNIEFRFYRNAELVKSLAIARVENGKLVPIPENFAELAELLRNFLSYRTQTINSSKKLSEIMAGKARMIKRVIYMTLLNNKDWKTEIHEQYRVFKEFLVHDLSEESFADIYSQTITYGLFTARLHDPTLPTFDRDEAAKLLPSSNPFLKKFFQNLRDNLDPRIEWIVDDLIEVFLAADVRKLLEWYGKTNARNDPIIHFYEDFLANYDKKLRKAKGVYYTPEPVVQFIVRSVDGILRTHFGLADGISDTNTVERKVEIQGKAVKKTFHKVQILDPATGTGTFLDSVVKYIYENSFRSMRGAWPDYVEKHLIPRLHGFEIMMASYAMAHLKLDLTLQETGFTNDNAERLGIYLTNSLEDYHDDVGTLFASWLSTESQDASQIKKNLPIMTIIGNPPYSGISGNNNAWIANLIDDYKKEPVTKENLKERKHWLNDDYVKFLRFAEHFVEKNNEGIVAFINPHGFLDNPTFRGMRYHLLETFDTIYVLDLHGNSKKKETCPDGSPDQNVFDIQQGVSINIFVKTGKKKKWQLASVFHADLYGKRDEKYAFLQEQSLETIDFTTVENTAPNFFFVPKDFSLSSEYGDFISVTDIFNINSTWIQSWNDPIFIWNSKEGLQSHIKDVSNEEVDEKYILPIDYRIFEKKYFYYIKNFQSNIYQNLLVPKSYRSRDNVMKHFILGENLGLIIGRQWHVVWEQVWNLAFITKNISDLNIYYRWGWSVFPLYLYSENQQLDTDGDGTTEKIPNLNSDTLAIIEGTLGLKLSTDFTPEQLLDYIYAILHSPTYRERYREFLKIDFPKINFDTTSERFFALSALGEKLRKLHLMEHISQADLSASFDISGSNTVEKVEYRDEKVIINDTQYFDHISEEVWNFFIGGYQVAQKWLKDRKGSTLSSTDILHYIRIVYVLSETIRLMQAIDEV